jgi:hypothetical protein
MTEPKKKDDDMNADTGGSRHCRAGLQRLVAVAVLTGAAVLAAACSGGSHTTGPSTSSGQLTVQEVDAFAQCMRSHGVPSFYFSGKASPGPGNTMFGYSVPASINMGSPQFQAANNACLHVAGVPSAPPAPLTAAQLHSLLKPAECVRAHGYPTYPDPVVHGEGIYEPTPVGIDTSSAQFQAVLRTCHAGP